MTENPSDSMRCRAQARHAQNIPIRGAMRKNEGRSSSMRRVRLEADVPARQLLPFGPPPLLEGEDAAAYDDLLVRISTAVKPTDIILDILVRDVVDLTWEALRLRRLKTALLTASAHIGLEVILKPLLDDGVAELVEAWARGERHAIERVKGILNSANLTMDAVIAQTVFEQIERLESMERMLAMAEARRNAALREIDRYRATRADAFRRAVDEVEHSPLQIVDMKSGGAKNAP
jgi:hypothetical protein